MINDYIEQAIQNIEVEKMQRVEIAKSSIMQEKIAPRNIEIDEKRDSAIRELQEKLATDIATLQATFEKQRQEIIDASETSKTANMNAVISAELGEIIATYDKAIAGLRAQIVAEE